MVVLLAVFRHTQRLLPWEVGAKASYNLTGAEAVLLRPVWIGRLEEGRWMMLNRTLHDFTISLILYTLVTKSFLIHFGRYMLVCGWSGFSFSFGGMR